MCHSHLNDMEIPETKRFIPRGFELDLTMNKVFFVFVFLSRAFQTRVLSFFSIKKCWEKEQLEQSQLAGEQLFEQFPVI